MRIFQFKAAAALLAITMMVPAVTVSLQAQAGSNCTAALASIDRIEQQTQQFAGEVRAQNLTFARTEVMDASMNATKTILNNRPTPSAALELRDRRKQWTDWAEVTKATGTTLNDLTKCLNTKGCSMIEFAGRQSAAIRLWMQALADGGLAAATDRASRAAELYRGYVTNALTVFQNAAIQSLAPCTTEFERLAVNAPEPPAVNGGRGSGTPATTAPKGGGGGSLPVIGGLGAAAALVYALKPKEETGATETSASTTSQPTSTTTTSTTSGVATFNGTYDFRYSLFDATVLGPNTLNRPGYITISNGRISGLGISGTVDANGNVTMSGPCHDGLGPTGENNVTWSGGRTSTNVFEGTYRCVGNTYTWMIYNKR